MINVGVCAAPQEVLNNKKSDKKNDKKCIPKSTSQFLNLPRKILHNLGVIVSLGSQ
jgi:hypothetical protein